MLIFDASAVIDGWEEYPPEHFPRLWLWLSEEIKCHRVSIPVIALNEVGHKLPECEKWLKDQGIRQIQIGNNEVAEALRIQGLLGIRDGEYHQDGIDENDLLIIAVASVHNLEVISHEEQQPRLPGNLKRYKIPAVCDMKEVNVSCIRFIDWIKRSGQVFG